MKAENHLLVATVQTQTGLCLILDCSFDVLTCHLLKCALMDKIKSAEPSPFRILSSY